MKTCTRLIGAVLVLCYLGFQSGSFVSAASLPARATQVDCDAVLRQLTQEPDWMDRLIDPILDSQPRVEERLGLYSQMHACIAAGTSDVNLKYIRELTEYFMIFIGGYQTPSDGSAFSMVDLASSEDAAVAAIRQKVGISPPPGYVYVRYYYSRQAMPDLVKQAFANPDVRGVTLFTRYVAVLADSSSVQLNALPKTVSHELVHAYLKSVQGVGNMDAFPTWYEEGMAVHFSGSSEPSCIYTTKDGVSGTSCETSPENYVQYGANLDYLENKLGQGKFLQVVKYSFEKLDPAILYQAGGFETYADFSVRARNWKRWQDFVPKAEIGGVCIAPFVIFLIIWFWRQVHEGDEERKQNLAYSNHPYRPYQGS
jgi:hypothetical protein